MKISVFYRGSVMWSIPVEESETWIVCHSVYLGDLYQEY